MASALDDDDLALSINPSHTRRGSARSPSEQSQAHLDALQQQATASQSRQQHLHASHAQARKDRLGQYNIIKTLGEGSFGKVKLAVHAVSGQKVALKIISRRKLMARDMAGRVEREIQYLQLLRHPHIIKLYTVIPMPNEIIMVLEYAGSELFNYIVDHGKMVEDKARQFFQQIVCAVEYCHRHKIVHRDLKPENLLLDDNLHVKIADFGLSNIMTDGNFLKTSCGSPNYAAPEVISGKLYAGPEVDVWSCGVILYVLLVGRLPFDDEYIPALFKKIAQGNYHVPQYLSSGAARLIRKMLQVSPVNRITVEGIRADPWFMRNLPEYLQPPVEEFLDTGVDPSKPIDPRSLAPTKPTEVVEKLHNSVVGKLGKTMGYGREDVQQALAVDEPNAIKDAYLIVRENQIMRDTPSLAKDPNMNSFFAQSPPLSSPSPISGMADSGVQSLNALHSSSPHKGQTQQARQKKRNSTAGTSQLAEARTPGGTIAVLPSSLPDYHRAFMAGQPKAPLNRDGESLSQRDSHDTSDKHRRPNLNPHSRSQLNLDKMNKGLEGMTPLHPPEKKKVRPPKWQFGIRSKNPAAEAMLAIYRALKAMGAEWEIPKTRRPGESNSDEAVTPDEQRDDGSNNSDSGDGTDSPQRRGGNNSWNSTSSRVRGRSRYGSWNDWGYAIPEDPWIINVRFRKGDMLLPGVLNSSANSSRADLSLDAANNPPMPVVKGSDPVPDPKRRISAMSSSGSISAMSGNASVPASHHGSASNSRTNLDSALKDKPMPSSNTGHSGNSNVEDLASSATTAAAANIPSNSTMGSNLPLRSDRISSISLSSAINGTGLSSFRDGQVTTADDSAYVYMTIQLYAIEKETYLVDFKCAGYERVVRRFVRQSLEADGMEVIESESYQDDEEIGEDDEVDEPQEEDDDDDEPQEEGEEADERKGMQTWEAEYSSGRPREGGNWEAIAPVKRESRQPLGPKSQERITRLGDKTPAVAVGGKSNHKTNKIRQNAVLNGQLQNNRRRGSQ